VSPSPGSEELVVQNASQIDGAVVVFARSLRLGPGGGLLGYCGHGTVVSAANRVPCPLASAIEATSSMPVAKVRCRRLTPNCAPQQGQSCQSGGNQQLSRRPHPNHSFDCRQASVARTINKEECCQKAGSGAEHHVDRRLAAALGPRQRVLRQRTQLNAACKMDKEIAAIMTACLACPDFVLTYLV
jgi:hypothetical protein